MLILILGLLMSGCRGGTRIEERTAESVPVDGAIGCVAGEPAYHVHAHLSVVVDGQTVVIAANTGIVQGCVRWLHTHDETGIVHIEPATEQRLTVGDFFLVWGQSLDAGHVLDRVVDPAHPIVVYLDGARYAGPAAGVPLEQGADIVLVYGEPSDPPPPYRFPDIF